MHLKVDLSILGLILGWLVLDWSCQFWVDRCQTTIVEVSGLSDSVLVVPSLDYNFLLVSQITVALFCIIIFWPEFCVFKDIQRKQTIGCGIKRGKLYYLDLQSKDSNKL